jgi:hypothetical protein
LHEFFGKNASFRTRVANAAAGTPRFERVFRLFSDRAVACGGRFGGRATSSRPLHTAGFLLFFALAPHSAGQEPPHALALRLPVSADTWVSAARGEEEGNNGASGRLKVKSCQELTLLDLDPAPLAGRVVVKATLHVFPSDKSPLLRATVSSVATPWVEGTGRSYEREPGAASFRWAETGRKPWGEPGGDLSDVILGAGHTRWSSSQPTPPDSDGGQALDVDPLVIATRVAGLGFGFALFDDIGSEYSRDGERFAYHPFPNRFLYSREAGGGKEPFWTIELGATDREPPGPVRGLKLYAGAQRLEWEVPPDSGPAGTLGFLVRFSTDAAFDWDTARDVPTRRVGKAGVVGTTSAADLRGLGLPLGDAITFAVRAVDAAGNLSTPSLCRGQLAVEPRAPRLSYEYHYLAAHRASLGFRLALESTSLPEAEGVMDDPSALDVHSARNEWVDFQMWIRGSTQGTRVAVELDDPTVRIDLYVGRSVATAGGRCADPLEAWDGRRELGPAAPDEGAALVFVDVFVPRTARPGEKLGQIVFERGDERIVTPWRLTVADFALPERLSFVPEMNAYDLVPPPFERAWYALAHEHRVNLNVLRYNWQGRVHEGCGPRVVDGALDWKDFDARFGPLLDGSAFADGTRGALPVEQFYLPLNENWPVPIEPHFHGGYWADAALDETYWREFARFSGLVAQHVKEKRWDATQFQFYLNDKIYHKGEKWSGSSAPWIFDEPTHTQDFFALQCFGRAFARGLASAGGATNVVFRVDVSRPQWQRDFLDGIAGVRVVGSAFAAYEDRVLDTKRRFDEKLFLYATANAVGTSNTMPAAWCIDAWCRGADGVIPWQTIGTVASWTNGDPLALFYPPRDGRPGPPSPSLRLKAFRRGQQDVEYLALWAAKSGLPRSAIAARVREALDLSSNARARFADDAGELVYAGVTALALERLRRAVADAIVRPP